MTRTGQDAIDYALSRVGTQMPAAGYCLQFTRECFAVAPYYASAIDAWNGADHRHSGDRNPPPAVPVWFATPSIYKHVAFHVGDGVCVSTYNADILEFASLSIMEAEFGGSYMGWAEDLNEVTVWTEDDDVAQLDDIEETVNWIKKRLGGSTGWDDFTARFDQQDKTARDIADDVLWLKQRIGGTTDDDSTNVTEYLRFLKTRVGGTEDGTTLSAYLHQIADDVAEIERLVGGG